MSKKKVYVNAVPYNKDIVTTALENGADAIWIESDKINNVRQLGKIDIISHDGDIIPDKDIKVYEINTKDDEINIAGISQKTEIIVKTNNWKIIPLENLIAQSDKIFAEVSSLEETKLVLTILEKGVAGVFVNTNDITELMKILKYMCGSTESIELTILTVDDIKPVGMGDRVCIDTCTNMSLGEGMLVGNTSSGYVLVHSESIDNPYVEQRPFRVNAGAVHAYLKAPENKTKYLSELKIGDEVLIVKFNGKTYKSTVGRVKIEKRPMLLLTCCDTSNNTISIILQNAETIRCVQKDGSPKSIVELKTGDEILGHLDQKGRHFGMAVDENIVEK